MSNASERNSSDGRPQLRYFRTNGPDKPERAQPKGFHENRIPADPKTIVDLVVERLTNPKKLSSMKPIPPPPSKVREEDEDDERGFPIGRGRDRDQFRE